MDGRLVEGLHFVSFQSDIANFLTILQRWMLNAAFPAAGTGVDALFDARKLASFVKGGLYFAVPQDERCVGAGMFDPPVPHNGVLRIRLAVTDAPLVHRTESVWPERRVRMGARLPIGITGRPRVHDQRGCPQSVGLRWRSS